MSLYISLPLHRFLDKPASIISRAKIRMSQVLTAMMMTMMMVYDDDDDDDDDDGI